MQGGFEQFRRPERTPRTDGFHSVERNMIQVVVREDQ